MATLPDISATSARPTMRAVQDVATIRPESGFERIGGQAIAEGGEKLAASGERLLASSAYEQRLADAQAKKDLKEKQRIAGIRAMTDFGNDVGDLAQAIKGGVQTQTIKSTEAVSQYDAAVKMLQEKYSQQNDPDVLEPVRIHMDNAFRDTRRQLVGQVEEFRRGSVLENFIGTREGLERRAINDLDGAQGSFKAVADSVLRDAGLKPQEIAREVQAFNEKTTFTYVAGQVNAAANDPESLAGLQKTITDTKQYPDLDPDRRRILLNQVESRQTILQARADREEEKRLNQLGREMDSISRLSLSGIQPTPDRLASLASGVKGTPYEAEFKSYLDGLAEQRKFSQLPPDQMRAELEKDVASVTKNGGNEADRLRITKRSQAYEMAAKQLTEDPLGYNARTTGAEVPPLDFAKPDQLQQQYQDRQALLLALNKTHGGSVALFRPDEAAQVRQMLRGMPAVNRASFLNNIYQATGSGATYNATLGQIAPDSPVTAFAGQLMNKNDVTVPHWFTADTKIQGAAVATRMLRGEDLINPPSAAKAEDGKSKGFQIGPEKDFATFFNSAAGKSFPGAESQRIRDTYYQAAKAVYADLAAEAGDRNGIVDGGRVKKAFELVTGGGVARFGDSDVIPPFGMSGDQLRSKVYAQFSQDVDEGKTKVPATYISSAGLYQIGDGRFLVKNGAAFLQDETTKQPLVIDVTGQEDVVAQPTPREKKKGRR